MITSIAFDTPIGTEYKRNNRSTRQKSLRCFPSCGAKGHVTGGFCGRPLKVVVELVREHNSLDIKIEDYRFIAEIRPLNQPGISKLKSLSEEDLQRQLRGRYDRNEFNGEIFQADTANILSIGSKMAEVELTFNSSHCSWDYSWKSNRWSGPQELHVVDIIVLRSASVNEVRVVSSALSSSFMISSSHKKPVKANRIKEEEEEEEDEYIVETTEAAGKGAKGRAKAEERSGGRSTRSSGGVASSAMVTKVIPEDTADVRGSYTGPTRQLKMSEDGKSISFSAETRTSTEESVNEGALALIQLLGVSGGQPAFPIPPPSSSAAAVSAAASYYGVPPLSTVSLPKRGEKRSLAPHYSEADGAPGGNGADTDKGQSKEKAAVPPGFPYPHYPFAFPGYPPHGYPPYPYPYPYPYGMPPPGAKKEEAAEEKTASAARKRGKKDDSASATEKAAASSPHLAPQYAPYPHPMYPPPPHMFPYPPPPHMGGPGGAAPTYPAMTMYAYPPPPYAMPPSTASLKGGPPGASSMAPGMPGGYSMPPFDPRNPYAHLMHHMGMPGVPSYPAMHMPYGLPYPPPPGYGGSGGPPKAAPGSTSTSDSEAETDDKDKDKASTATPLPSALLPACGSAEKVPVAVPIGITSSQIPNKLASLALPKRGDGAAPTAAEVPSIQEPRPDSRLSVYDILAERAREREKLRVASGQNLAPPSTASSER